jgi:hypothetical protein
MCASMILSLLVISIIAFKNFISTACIYLLVHVHVSTPYNYVFLKYTLYVLHFLSMPLFHNMLFFKLWNCEAFLILSFFHSVYHHYSLPCFPGR